MRNAISLRFLNQCMDYLYSVPNNLVGSMILFNSLNTVLFFLKFNFKTVDKIYDQETESIEMANAIPLKITVPNNNWLVSKNVQDSNLENGFSESKLQLCSNTFQLISQPHCSEFRIQSPDIQASTKLKIRLKIHHVRLRFSRPWKLEILHQFKCALTS